MIKESPEGPIIVALLSEIYSMQKTIKELKAKLEKKAIGRCSQVSLCRNAQATWCVWHAKS